MRNFRPRAYETPQCDFFRNSRGAEWIRREYGNGWRLRVQRQKWRCHFHQCPESCGIQTSVPGRRSSSNLERVVDSDYDGYIQNASGRYNIDPDLIRAVIKAESDFKVSARSNKGAMGLMQLMPDTARLHNVSDAYNPGENVEGGARHLRMLLDRYQGDLELSLAAYNAGSAAVEKHRGIPPFPETREYVRRVLRFYDSYRNALPSFQPVAQQ
jgi:Soluble lytic murein transglycosylase and related regulatory proteins (some contain LysM/invasin domains)